MHSRRFILPSQPFGSAKNPYFCNSETRRGEVALFSPTLFHPPCPNYPRMKSFLDSIAEAYYNNEQSHLLDTCFVFPNKRAATFFTDSLRNLYLADNPSGGFIDPPTTTIVEFAESFTDTCAADRMEMLFMLYEAYRDAVLRHHGREEAERVDFNRFVYWGDVLLTDFDDVDNALATPAEIFKNVKDLKQLSANYLSKDQLDILKEYIKDLKTTEEGERFWNHMVHSAEKSYNRKNQKKSPKEKAQEEDDREENAQEDDSEVSSLMGFLRLWQVMLDIYTNFRSRLSGLGLHTSGMAFRRAAESVKDMTWEDFPYRRYVFVGFNSLSQAESQIFKRMKEMKNSSSEPLADFYWDLASPAFRHKSMAGTVQVEQYAERFPSLYDCVAPVQEFPPIINVYGVPSRVGQAKAIGGLLNTLFPPVEKDNEKDESDTTANSASSSDRLLGTAIVMPDEMLLTPLVNSLPPQITPLNLTMGYKLRNTAVAGLLRNIVSMQMRAYSSKSKNQNSFFHEDVTHILAHPLVRAVQPEAVAEMLKRITRDRMFNIPETFFTDNEKYTPFAPLFRMVSNKNSSHDVFHYLHTVLGWLYTSLSEKWGVAKETEEEEETDTLPPSDPTTSTASTRPRRGVPVFTAVHEEGKTDARSKSLQMAFLRRFAHAVKQLEKLRAQYLEGKNVYLEDSTVFNLVERIVQGEMLNFDGQPLQGLQVMGVLEARALDFSTLIIPSMNERIFPSAKFNPSFIPQVIRKEFQLSTSEDQENSFTYFFYRMISRAERVFLLYDARTSGAKSNHLSRFVQQLSYIFKPQGLKLKVLPYKMSATEKPDFTVAKTPEILRILEQYRTPGSGKWLSATSIKNYLACPMQFYFEKIAGYRNENEMNDWMDEGEFGTITHAVMEHFYESLLNRAPDSSSNSSPNPSQGVRVLSSHIEDFVKKTPKEQESELDRECRRCINHYYKKLSREELDNPLSGDLQLTSKMISQLVEGVLRKEITPFTYLHSEWDHNMVLHLAGKSGKTLDINFTCKIDRVDHIDTIEGKDGQPASYPRTRIIDYKTGSDDIQATNIHTALHDSHQKAFLQLMLYCQAYAQETGQPNEVIQPLIFPMRKMMVNGVLPLKWCAPAGGDNVPQLEHKAPARANSKWTLLDYRDYLPEFNDALIAELETLFDPATSFRCASTDDPCKYCSFKLLCAKSNK